MLSQREVELYSGYTKASLKRFRAGVTEEKNGAAAIAAEALKYGTPLYEQLMTEAGPNRRPKDMPAPAANAQVPAPSPAVTRDELKQMLAEAVKSSSKEQQAAISSDADAPNYRVAENPDNYALVIGVEKYAGLPDAIFAERDAKAVYDHLVALGYPRRNIALLTGSQATRTGIVKNLEAWLPANVNEKSTVFFYYSGHGAPDPTQGTAYLLPMDGDPSYLEQTAYPIKRLYDRLAALKAKRVLVAMDSCFSGAGGRSVIPRGTRPLVGKIDAGVVSGKVAALTASASNQISGTIETQGHGLFTYYLLKGLNGDARDGNGRVTMKSLFDYLSPRVRDQAKIVNRDQAPQLLPAVQDEEIILR